MKATLTDEQKSAIAEIVFEKWEENKTDLSEADHDNYIGYLQGLGDTHYYTIIEEFMEPIEDDGFDEPANWKDLTND